MVDKGLRPDAGLLEALLDGICEVGRITFLTGKLQFLRRGDHLSVTQDSRRAGVAERGDSECMSVLGVSRRENEWNPSHICRSEQTP